MFCQWQKQNVDVQSTSQPNTIINTQGCHPLEQKQFPDFSLTVEQFSLNMQDDYSGCS